MLVGRAPEGPGALLLLSTEVEIFIALMLLMPGWLTTFLVLF